jgi:hypothetical protein
VAKIVTELGFMITLVFPVKPVSDFILLATKSRHQITITRVYFYSPSEVLISFDLCDGNNDYHKQGYHSGN